MATNLQIRPDEISALLKQQILDSRIDIDVYESGTVQQVGDGVARVQGLGNVQTSELVEFPNGIMGMALNLEEDNVGCVLFGDDTLIREGDEAKRTGRIAEVPVGEALPRSRGKPTRHANRRQRPQSTPKRHSPLNARHPASSSDSP